MARRPAKAPEPAVEAVSGPWETVRGSMGPCPGRKGWTLVSLRALNVDGIRIGVAYEIETQRLADPVALRRALEGATSHLADRRPR